MEIRQATPADCPAIEKVMQNAFGPFKQHYTPLAYANTVVNQEELLKRMTKGITWVAIDDEQILGTVSVAFHKEWLYITGMAVDPKAQGKKMGYQLMAHLEDYARNNGHAQLYLGTVPYLLRAVALYKNMGYYPREIHKKKWCGIDTIWFEKTIKTLAIK